MRRISFSLPPSPTETFSDSTDLAAADREPDVDQRGCGNGAERNGQSHDQVIPLLGFVITPRAVVAALRLQSIQKSV